MSLILSQMRLAKFRLYAVPHAVFSLCAPTLQKIFQSQSGTPSGAFFTIFVTMYVK